MDLTRLLPADMLSALTFAPPGDALVAALVSAVATLSLIAGFAPRRRSGRGAPRGAPSRQADAGTACEFLVLGSSLKALTEPARALLADLGPAPSPMAALSEHLARDCPDIRQQIEALALYGTAFRTHCTRSDGSVCEISGRPDGGAAILSIDQPSDDSRALHDAQAALARAAAEVRFLSDVIDQAPVLAWSLGPDAQVAWANAPYREQFDSTAEGLQDHRIGDAFGHVIEEVPLTARGAETRRRVSVPGREGAEPHWYELSECPGPDGTSLGFAVEADDLVSAEASLRRFVETLTETFAHLPIGLAVFDKNRRLGLFNPALTDLVRIDAVWLAGRPSLRDFLERLRETRQMPEQKDFAAWRRKLGELEEGARDGTYEENWVLPSGKVFRVTGRPHPQGAVAFLFEDISTAIQLERRYRSELELSQATLDRLAEAVAVFDASGSLVFVNSAFEALWGLDAMEQLEGPGVAEMTAIWTERCGPSPAWAQIAEYATAAEARGSWTTTIETRDRRRLHMAVAPLPDASALVVFRDLTGESRLSGSRDPILDELALEQLQMPAEAAVRQVMAAIPSVQGAEAFQSITAAAQALKDGLARSRELSALAGPESAETAPLASLASALTARGLTLAAPAGAGQWTAAERRTALALVLAAADRAAEGAAVTLTAEPAPGGLRLSARTPARAGSRAEAPSLPLARRIVEASAGRLEVTTRDGVLELRAEPSLPADASPHAIIARSA